MPKLHTHTHTHTRELWPASLIFVEEKHLRQISGGIYRYWQNMWTNNFCTWTTACLINFCGRKAFKVISGDIAGNFQGRKLLQIILWGLRTIYESFFLHHKIWSMLHPTMIMQSLKQSVTVKLLTSYRSPKDFSPKNIHHLPCTLYATYISMHLRTVYVLAHPAGPVDTIRCAIWYSKT